MHRKKQARRGEKQQGIFINHHHKKLQSINWKTTVIPRNQHVLRDKIMERIKAVVSRRMSAKVYQPECGIFH
jgi:hypothetical protein